MARESRVQDVSHWLDRTASIEDMSVHADSAFSISPPPSPTPSSLRPRSRQVAAASRSLDSGPSKSSIRPSAQSRISVFLQPGPEPPSYASHGFRSSEWSMWKRNQEAGDRLRASSRQRIRDSETDVQIWGEQEKIRVEAEHRERLDRMEDKIRSWEGEESDRTNLKEQRAARLRSQERREQARKEQALAVDSAREARRQKQQAEEDRRERELADEKLEIAQSREGERAKRQRELRELGAKAQQTMEALDLKRQPSTYDHKPVPRRENVTDTAALRPNDIIRAPLGKTSPSGSSRLPILSSPTKNLISRPTKSILGRIPGISSKSTIGTRSGPPLDSIPIDKQANHEDTIESTEGDQPFEEDQTLEQLMAVNNVPEEAADDPKFERDETLEQLIKAEKDGKLNEASMKASTTPPLAKISEDIAQATRAPFSLPNAPLTTPGDPVKVEEKPPTAAVASDAHHQCEHCGHGSKEQTSVKDAKPRTEALSSYLTSLLKTLSPLSRKKSWSPPSHDISVARPRARTKTPASITNPHAEQPSPQVIVQYRLLPPLSHWLWKVLLSLLTLYIGAIVSDWYNIDEAGCVKRHPGNKDIFGYHPAWYDPICILLFCGQGYAFAGSPKAWGVTSNRGNGMLWKSREEAAQYYGS